MRRRALMIGSVLGAGLVRLAHATPPPTVLELFTSQGCSSCPPADTLLGELVHQPGVIALAWHVDYWNSLGWRDPYATRLATDRQRAYAAQLQGEVYTPALVVNGAQILVGSDRQAIADAMGHIRAAPLALVLGRNEAGLQADLGDTPTALMALLAVYDPEHATAIGAGENEGRKLREYRIVRAVHRMSVPPGSARTLSFPAIAPGQGAALLLQSEDLRVIAAADLTPV